MGFKFLGDRMGRVMRRVPARDLTDEEAAAIPGFVEMVEAGDEREGTTAIYRKMTAKEDRDHRARLEREEEQRRQRELGKWEARPAEYVGPYPGPMPAAAATDDAGAEEEGE